MENKLKQIEQQIKELKGELEFHTAIVRWCEYTTLETLNEDACADWLVSHNEITYEQALYFTQDKELLWNVEEYIFRNECYNPDVLIKGYGYKIEEFGNYDKGYFYAIFKEEDRDYLKSWATEDHIEIRYKDEKYNEQMNDPYNESEIEAILEEKPYKIIWRI